MILLIDVGNTNITIGIHNKDTLEGSYRLTTKTKRTSDEYGFLIVSFLHESNIKVNDINAVVVSSVVPQVMHTFTNAIRKFLHQEPQIISSTTKTGIGFNFPNADSVGSDRLVDLAGAYHEYGGPCIVVDFGTATTFDYVDKDGIFQYGFISLGLEMTATTLSDQAAKLPEFQIQVPPTRQAKDTITSMQGGIIYGYIGQVENLIKVLKEEIGEDVKVIATGGMGRLISELTDAIDVYDSELIFKGLLHIYNLNK